MTRTRNLSSISFRYTLAAAAFTLCAGLGSATVSAQDGGPTGSIGDPRLADCENVPGGNAPINRIARLTDGLSVRNLDLTYFGKTLEELTAEDFRYLEELWPVCGTFEPPVAIAISVNAKRVIDEAKAVKQRSEDWLADSKLALSQAGPGRQTVQEIHDVWQGLINREFEMSRAEFDDMVAFLAEQQERISAMPHTGQDSLIDPFHPGEPDVRDIDG